MKENTTAIVLFFKFKYALIKKLQIMVCLGQTTFPSILISRFKQIRIFKYVLFSRFVQNNIVFFNSK